MRLRTPFAVLFASAVVAATLAGCTLMPSAETATGDSESTSTGAATPNPTSEAPDAATAEPTSTSGGSDSSDSPGSGAGGSDAELASLCFDILSAFDDPALLEVPTDPEGMADLTPAIEDLMAQAEANISNPAAAAIADDLELIVSGGPAFLELVRAMADGDASAGAQDLSGLEDFTTGLDNLTTECTAALG